jgi:hypothetical protein
MSVSGDGKPDEKTPRSPEPESSSGATEGLPPDRQVDLPTSAEMLRQASGSSIDSFAGEGADLSLLIAEQFQRDTPILKSTWALTVNPLSWAVGPWASLTKRRT